MHNELALFAVQHEMLQPGDTVFCAVSGGADSVALLWAMFLLKDKLGIRLEAAHFNHRLRGEESDRDEAFVRDFCAGYGIPLTVGSGDIHPGEKGLEAAARDARYAFFATLPGKVATAHTADDNLETVLMHLLRGTGLKGLGGIAPVRSNYIRPMLNITRQQVLSFLEEYHLPYRTDSSNATDAFLRNRLRHGVIPLLKEENPSLAKNVSLMAQRLRQDEQALTPQLPMDDTLDIAALQAMPDAMRSRCIRAFLARFGLTEASSAHVALAQQLLNSDNPSARAVFPGGLVLCRSYDRLCRESAAPSIPPVTLTMDGCVTIPQAGYTLTCTMADTLENDPHCFTLCPRGQITVRSRQSGDCIRLPGGTKSLKKLFIDRKIPASLRPQVPVIADEEGILAVVGIGVNLDRAAHQLPAWKIRAEKNKTDIT